MWIHFDLDLRGFSIKNCLVLIFISMVVVLMIYLPNMVDK
jgi:hypothetical protein